jgi:hypothetical protein
MNGETIRCECLIRQVHGPARVDLWYAEEKESYWIEIYVGTTRIYQSPGYAARAMAEVEHERQCRSLIARVEAWRAQRSGGLG